jgi:hypothetical protein
MDKKDRSLDLSIFLKNDQSLDLTKHFNYKENTQVGGAKKKSANKRKKTTDDKAKYKQEWYKKNATKGKNVKEYNKKYYEEHKKQLKLKREKNK